MLFASSLLALLGAICICCHKKKIMRHQLTEAEEQELKRLKD